MDVSRKTEIRVGLVSIGAIVLLLAGIMLGKGLSLSTNLHQIRFRMATSGGIEPGSPIVVHGVKRGQVTKVSNHSGAVVVVGEVDDIADLHADATGRVVILEITGGKKIELDPGVLNAPLDPAREIPAVAASDIGSLVTSLGDMSVNAVVLVKRLDTLSAALADLARDGSFINNVKTLASDGATLVTDARVWMQENKNDLSGTVKDLRSISATLKKTLDRNEPKISDLIDHLDRTLSTFDKTLTKADRAFISVDSVVVEINDVISAVRSNKSLLNRIIYDEHLATDMDSALVSLRAILDRIDHVGVNVNVGLGHK